MIGDNEARRAEIRARMKREREILQGDPAAYAGKSLAAQAALERQPIFAGAQVLALYYAIKGEVGTELLIRHALENGQAVYLPGILENGAMEFARIMSPLDLAPGPFGTMQPKSEGLGPGKFSPDLMIVPGLAFDRAGHRLGYGGGYYDRFIAQRKAPWPLAGLCFAFQLVDEIPAMPWDLRLDYIVDENGCRKVDEPGK